MNSLPPEFVERMKSQLGSQAEDFFRSLAQSSPTSIRLNHLKGKTSFALAEKVPWCENGFYLESRPSFYLDPHWHGGAYYVQEASSMILDHVLSQIELEEKARIWIDLCAAPGGKTGILAKHLGPQDVLVANEVVGQRRTILRENLTKAGYLNTIISGEPSSSFQHPFADIILIDAPCAGEGMMRKDDEAIRQWTPHLVQSCSTLQKQIVEGAANALKEDGILIYSTCSYSLDENIRNIQHFVRNHGLVVVSISFPEDWNIVTLQEEDAIGYQLYPHRVKGEGLFIAVMKKLKTEEEAKYQKAKKPFYLFEQVPAWLGTHLSYPETYRVRKNNPTLQLVTAAAEAKANELLMHIPRAEIVAEAGELKGKDFVPSHAIAMSGIQHPDYEIIELDLTSALDFLERSASSMPMDKKPGWYLVGYEGTILGWSKYTGTAWKNHYPMHWRLRDRNKK